MSENSNTITITLDDVLGPDGLEGAWEGMVQKLANAAEGKFLHAENGKSFHAACVDAINEAVTTKIAAKIEEKMKKPIQLTDRWGTAQGEPTTFNALIGQAVENAMSTKVDIYGRPKSDGKRTLLEHALGVVALEGLQKAVTDEVRKVNAMAKEAVAKEVANAIAKTLK
ncbi:MAG: hypothetical protein KDJ66_10805 [Nitratireductor sp.]|nr:hypothetical protein [Nitratireductor sp.]